jgi:UDP-arabinose 4-epimerase
LVLSERKVLVTGGAGYVGSHACKALARAGFVPVTYDNLSNGHEWAVRYGPLERGDILDRQALDVAIARHAPVAVLHFAALAYVGVSVSDPATYYRNNVAGSLNLLEAMKDAGIGAIVFSSTCATYGVPPPAPISEGTPQHPINPYGATKLVVEWMLRDFAHAYGLRYAALRYFNASGADPDNEIGEAHFPETHLIPLALDAASGRGGELSVFGDDYDTPDGTCIRDYIHVSDLADAHVLALEALLAGMASNAFNLGNGNGFSVRDVLGAIRRATGLEVPHRIAPRRAGDPALLVADASRARDVLGWRPRHDDLDEIIRTAWAWHQKAIR